MDPTAYAQFLSATAALLPQGPSQRELTAATEFCLQFRNRPDAVDISMFVLSNHRPGGWLSACPSLSVRNSRVPRSQCLRRCALRVPSGVCPDSLCCSWVPCVVMVACTLL
jgi:hypothetical protein